MGEVDELFESIGGSISFYCPKCEAYVTGLTLWEVKDVKVRFGGNTTKLEGTEHRYFEFRCINCHTTIVRLMEKI